MIRRANCSVNWGLTVVVGGLTDWKLLKSLLIKVKNWFD